MLIFSLHLEAKNPCESAFSPYTIHPETQNYEKFNTLLGVKEGQKKLQKFVNSSSFLKMVKNSTMPTDDLLRSDFSLLTPEKGLHFYHGTSAKSAKAMTKDQSFILTFSRGSKMNHANDPVEGVLFLAAEREFAKGYSARISSTTNVLDFQIKQAANMADISIYSSPFMKLSQLFADLRLRKSIYNEEIYKNVLIEFHKQFPELKKTYPTVDSLSEISAQALAMIAGAKFLKFRTMYMKGPQIEYGIIDPDVIDSMRLTH
jgi:hypothetical protein